MSNHTACCLCAQIRGDQDGDLIARLLPRSPYTRRVLLETDAFAVIPDVSPLADGHVLLCPKPHVKSFAQLRVEAHGELDRLKRRLRALLLRAFAGEVHVFEHGMEPHGKRVLCTIDHAHLHFLPLPPGVAPVMLQERTWTDFDGSVEALARLTDGREYVLYETPAGVSRVHIPGSRPLPSQFMREAFRDALGGGAAWKWQDLTNAPAADMTWQRCVAAGGTAAGSSAC